MTASPWRMTSLQAVRHLSWKLCGRFIPRMGFPGALTKASLHNLGCLSQVAPFFPVPFLQDDQEDMSAGRTRRQSWERVSSSVDRNRVGFFHGRSILEGILLQSQALRNLRTEPRQPLVPHQGVHGGLQPPHGRIVRPNPRDLVETIEGLLVFLQPCKGHPFREPSVHIPEVHLQSLLTCPKELENFFWPITLVSHHPAIVLRNDIPFHPEIKTDKLYGLLLSSLLTQLGHLLITKLPVYPGLEHPDPWIEGISLCDHFQGFDAFLIVLGLCQPSGLGEERVQVQRVLLQPLSALLLPEPRMVPILLFCTVLGHCRDHSPRCGS